MVINIKIEGLEQLTEALALLGSATAFKNGMVNTAKEAIKLADDVVDKPENTKVTKKTEKEIKVDDPQEIKEPEKKETTLTREEVRAALVAKNSPSTREQLKTILDKYDAPNISKLKEEHFEDVMKELEAL